MRTPHGVVASLVVAIAILTGALVLSGCGGSNSKQPTSPGAGTGTVSGLVSDAVGGAPVVGALVKASSGASATSDANGRFTLSVAANANVRIDVTRADRSLNQVVVRLAAGETKSLRVSLIAAGATASVATATGGKVTDASGATLTLPAGFVTTSGNVTVRVTGLDPTTSQVKALPGGLDAVDANGHAVYMKPVSFAEYTVTDGSGNVLQFNPSASSGANIELPIPASLRGQSGYQNGDPIECYVYDPSDGKWKTPVPGVIGNSSVDGTTPVIKATIFHLSWYGGAPAAPPSCVEGNVTLNGAPVAGCAVSAYPGGTTLTDAAGHYELAVAANSEVYVNATLVDGVNFRSSEGHTLVGSAGATCAHLDLSLGSQTSGQYNLFVMLSKSPLLDPSPVDLASAKVQAMSGFTMVDLPGARVDVGTGGTWWTLPYDSASTFFQLRTGEQGFTLTPGAVYQVRIDYSNDGTWDATGTATLPAYVTMTSPADNATVGKSFTMQWTDPTVLQSGYPNHYLVSMINYVAGFDQFFTTANTHFTVGDGSTGLGGEANPPLPAVSFSVIYNTSNGPIETYIINGGYAPNITGTGVFSGAIETEVQWPTYTLTSTGTAPRLIAGSAAKRSDLRLRVPSPEQRVQDAYGRWRQLTLQRLTRSHALRAAR